ncbi:hypothetical protein WV31_13300 [Magnetospirillum sp. ME-1]|uniref:oligosaccharide flippase family protein n=1 Tax=Magnetospirillum sp. ME-1 TaxID=1639348 RepID=UPI000A17F79F|nr:oligosaccharide flippase family protein [Magnetospirillum sp. ME-1]ARJ66575.1 hypothetical protein WV31_13300 [Magnetospirillum sp. ME-1]
MSAIPRFGEIVKGGMFLAGGGVVQALIAFGAQIVLMRLLRPEDFGEFAMVLAGCGLVQMVLSLRLNAQIIRAGEQALDGPTRVLYHSALCWETLLASLVTLVWLAAAGLISTLSLVLVLALTLGQWVNQALSFWERGMPYRQMAMVDTGALLVGHAASVGLVLAGAGAMALPLRELIVVLVRIGLLMRVGALGLFGWRWVRPDEWRRLVREAGDLWGEGLVEGGFARLVVLGSGWVGGAHGAGIFSQAMRLALVPHQFLSPVVNRMFANLFSRLETDGERRAVLLRGGGWTAAALVPGAALAVWFADPLVPLLFGAHWAEASHVLAAMAGVILFYSLFELVRAYCLSRRLTRHVMVARAAQYAVFCAGLAWAASGGGIQALSLALSLSYAAVFLVTARPVYAGLARRP